jgi:hypothetical protein
MPEDLTAEAFQQIKDSLKAAQVKIDRLESDNYNYRSKLRELKAELAQAKDAIPPENAVVLTDDDIQTWETFKALGTPADVKSKLEKLDEAENKLKRHQRTEQLRSVADATGYDFDVLATLSGNLDFEMTTHNDEQIVTVKTEDGQTMPIAEYAEKHWSKFLPALAPTNSTGGKRMPPQHTGTPPHPRTPKGTVPDALAEFLESREKAKKPNPLLNNKE